MRDPIDPLRRFVAMSVLAMSVLGMLLGTACSARQWYEGHRFTLRADCLRLPSDSEMQRCLEATDIRYDDYQRQRDGSDRPGSGDR